jgi:hypothetical protein
MYWGSVTVKHELKLICDLVFAAAAKRNNGVFLVVSRQAKV